MGKFLGVNISDEEQLLLQNKIIPKLMKDSGKIVPDGADILHELILGYDPIVAERARAEKQDISETTMYSEIKKAIKHSIGDDIRESVNTMKNKYHWTNKMISYVFTFCAKKEKGYTNYVSKVAENWFKEGVKTYQDMLFKSKN